jgi:superfamily II DNA/RNA helicase
MESYIHRIGRAGRFGRKGTTINMVIPAEEAMMKDICQLYNIKQEFLPEDLSTLSL